MNIPTPARGLLGLLLLAVCAAAPAAPERYELDPDHTVIGFLVMHIGYARVLGRFRDVGGSYTFDEETGELSDVRITVRTESVYTAHRERDDHLRSADFLNSAEFPEMVFSADSAESLGERRYRVDGELTLLGQTRSLSLELTWNKSAQYPIGGVFSKPYVMGVSGRGSFQRSDFGMTYGVDNGLVADTVE
ncbi:MAG: YceI family protein, partial [Candidatus Competibacterales bacterium]|nr:YceI family protein [Candidatus Competibacterales bacterium]